MVCTCPQPAMLNKTISKTTFVTIGFMFIPPSFLAVSGKPNKEARNSESHKAMRRRLTGCYFLRIGPAPTRPRRNKAPGFPCPPAGDSTFTGMNGAKILDLGPIPERSH